MGTEKRPGNGPAEEEALGDVASEIFQDLALPPVSPPPRRCRPAPGHRPRRSPL